MKISNETKVGAIAVVAVTLLILGFNFLKGKKLFTESTSLYGIYNNVQGLQPSNPIIINGLQVGTVYKISTDKDMNRITVEMNITRDINIPRNSVALIKSNPIGSTSMEIKLGDANTYLANRDTIFTEVNAGVFDAVLQKIDPVLYEVKRAVSSMDSLLVNINSLIDPNAKNNIGATLANLKMATSSMVASSASLQQLLNTQTGSLAKTLDNMSAITGNLAQNNPRINSVMENLDLTSQKLARIELEKTMATLDQTVNELKNTVDRINSKDGSLGMFLNDTRLYNNLASTGNKLNLLLDDIRMNPKRYVSISVFGRKGSNPPLMTPLPDTVSSPYIIKHIDD